ncbi:GGDEF domain-containing protein [Paraglaciecola sp. 2405UD69-4]|uniref:GGDEF domain-containing protein n=1 Tax=Paraglaciecola sp. 2405UD69-4 TaxID=3391836 RepID=UPI0039C9672D
MFFEKIRHEITVKAAFLIFLITLLATVVRPMLIDQSVYFTYIGALNSLLLGSMYLYFKHTKPKAWHPMLFVCMGVLILSPITFISGGVNSQFAFVFPVIPIFITLVGNAKYTWITAILLFITVILMYLNMDFFPDYTFETVSANKTASRAVWLCLAILLSTTFGVQLSRIYGTLGNKISEQAATDQLTALHNRHSLMQSLHTMLQDAKIEEGSLSVMMIDIDHFKAINDNYGHLAGDKCLKKIAELIKQNVRGSQDLAGRYGGEEFIVAIKDISPSKASNIANSIRTDIEKTAIYFNDLQKINVTATVGVCTIENSKLESVEQLIGLADEALYKGKHNGRNQVVVA